VLDEIAKKAAEAEANRAAGVPPPAAGEDGSDADEDGDADRLGVHARHRKKRGTIWSVFDLSKEAPTCTVKVGDDGICGCAPSVNGGTSNYWSHLQVHHRAVWLELKQQAGQLTGAGLEELSILQKCLVDRLLKSADDSTFSTLPEEATRTIDRVVADWIIDTDGDLNDAELPSFRHLMRAVSSQAYSGCCHSKIAGLVTQSAALGVKTATAFHEHLAADGIKPSISGDLWSKNGAALLGLMSHGIIETPCADGTVNWVMTEVLSGSVPCAKDHHTGDHVDGLSNEAWKKVGIEDPVKDIFRRKSDEGSNMIKVSVSLLM